MKEQVRTMTQKPTMNLAEAAAALGVSREKLKKMTLAREVPGMKSDDLWLFSRAAIETFLATGQWPRPNPEPAEIAALVVKQLVKTFEPAIEAFSKIAEDFAEEVPRAGGIRKTW